MCHALHLLPHIAGGSNKRVNLAASGTGRANALHGGTNGSNIAVGHSREDRSWSERGSTCDKRYGHNLAEHDVVAAEETVAIEDGIMKT